jgi:hypothetical protein
VNQNRVRATTHTWLGPPIEFSAVHQLQLPISIPTVDYGRYMDLDYLPTVACISKLTVNFQQERGGRRKEEGGRR